VEAKDARQIYLYFLVEAVVSRQVWTLQCHGDWVAVEGAGNRIFPLWPELESARFAVAQFWPKLSPAELSLRMLLREHLPFLEQAQIPAGVGLAPFPEGVIVPANRLRRDLLEAKRLCRTYRRPARP